MNYHLICKIQGFLCMGFGAAFILGPLQLLGLVGLQTNAVVLLLCRLIGGFLIALGVAIYVARNELGRASIQLLCLSNLAVDTGLGVALFQAAQNGTINSFGYVFAGVFALSVVFWLVAYFRRN